MLCVQQITDKLRELGIKFKIDEQSDDIYAVVSKAKIITVVTNVKAKRNYDDEHPERIVAFIVFPDQTTVKFRVIVNNRTTDLSILKFWCEEDNLATTCDICFKKLQKYFMCSTCTGKVCVHCDNRITKGNPVKKCPVCQKWQLPGHSFGLPCNMLTVTPYAGASANAANGINQLRHLLEQLDGETSVMLRIDNEFILGEFEDIEDIEDMTRLFYMKKGLVKTRPRDAEDEEALNKTMRAIRKRRQGTGTHDFMVYVLRDTFVITDGKPTTEGSIYKIGPAPDFKLYPYSADAWIPVFDLDTTLIKVAYLEPYDFRQDMGGFDLIADTMPDICDVIACSVATGEKSKGFNFDVENKKICTMHVDMVNVCLSMCFSTKQDIYIIWRSVNPKIEIISGYKLGGVDRVLNKLSGTECRRAIKRILELRV